MNQLNWNRFCPHAAIDYNRVDWSKSRVKAKCKPIWWWAKKWARQRVSTVNRPAVVRWQLLFTAWCAPGGDTRPPNKVCHHYSYDTV